MREALGFWWKLGWISFGGTAAHLAIMHSELVEKRRWIDSDDLFHALSHCMLLPGPEAQQLAIYLGWKLHGKLGGLLAGTLFVLPSTAILLGLSLLYARYGSVGWVTLLFRVLKPIVVALVLRALFQIGRRALRSGVQWLAAVASFLALSLLHIPLPWIMGMMVAMGVLVGLVQRLRGIDRRSSAEKTAGYATGAAAWRTLRIVGGCAAIGSVPLLLLGIFARDFPFWMRLSAFFTQTAFVTIGGSYTVIPYVAQIAVMKFGWLSHAQMLDGFALAETTPGPLIIVVGFVGFMAGFHHFQGSFLMGTIALLVTIFYTFLPCFLFVFIGAPWIARSGESQLIRSALKLITAAVVAAILQLTVFLVRGVVFPAGSRSPNVWAGVWIVSAFVVIHLIHRHAQRVSRKRDRLSCAAMDCGQRAEVTSSR
ncbi:MAG TPA: chromate efflux transporter [Acidobacteriaceae bacterium]|jgi:chromate transporter|nr:chromate efflux transporter [Acidobacteriaceae bacterium]